MYKESGVTQLITTQTVTKKTGVTVRALRHYDHIGLLLPAGKTAGGHRLYGEEELTKLQEIQFLKTLGFSLQEIKDMLADETWEDRKSTRLNSSHVSISY